jgi:PAS domain S-box-containing protein
MNATGVLRDAELSALYDTVQEGVLVLDACADGEYRVAAINHRLAALLGVQHQDCLGRLVQEITSPDSAARLLGKCAVVATTKQAVQWRAVATYPAGTMQVEITLTPLLDAGGACRRLLVVVSDETEAMRREEARLALERQAELQYRSFNMAVAAISDVVYVLDREGRFTYASRPLLYLLQRTPEEVIGKDVRDLGTPPAAAEQVLGDIALVVRTGQAVRGETPFTGADGVEGYHEYIFHPILDTDGRVSAVAGSSRDVSERRRMAMQLVTQSKEQRELAEQLELEHDRLRQAQAVAKIGSWVMDLATSTISWSEETYRICGIDRSDAAPSYELFLARVHPDDRDALIAAYAKAGGSGTPFLFEHRLLMPDGTVKWVQERCEFTAGPDGTTVRAVGTTQDITEQKAAEVALQQSQQLLRIASRVGRIGGWDVDLTTMKVSWSEQVCAIHGVPAGFAPSVEEAIHFYAEEDRPTIQAAVAACVGSATPFDLELRIVTAQGAPVWVRAIGEAAVDHNGTVTGIQGAFQDISELKDVHDALQRSNERFRLVAQATSDVVWDYDLAQGEVWWSEGLRTQLGYDVDPVTDVDFRSRNIHPEDRQRVVEGFQAAVASARLWRDEYRFRKADGTYAQVIDRAFVVRDAEGRASRVVGATVDVTQQRILEAQLEQIQRVASLGQLAANMAHEFNNVLMGIQPFAEMLGRVTQLPLVQDATTHIMQSVRRGKKVTDEILRFTRRIEPTFKPVDVLQWLRDFHAEAVALVGDTLRVELSLPSDPLHLHGDMSQLNQVLANLVINARDASAPEGRIVIGARCCTAPQTGERVVDVAVRDFGCGMDAATMARIFDPMFTTKKHGTGLGLAISTQVVRAHAGTIHVESEPGVGTTFHILLPLRPAGTEDGRQEELPAGALPARVLIVEDDPSVAEGIAMLLECEGVVSSFVSTGLGAIAAIEEAPPELVFLDIGLPDISGVEVFQQIHDRWPHLRIVLMTGHYSPTDLQSILSLPHVAFLQKPFGGDDIVKVLKLTHGLAGRSQAAVS